ncbi:MAG: 30S ribosome-binding factor RbfA [Clostridia bacterium]|nr:30S ribosome-binding factor RbfA [Clostridia bacterium]
MNLDRVNSELAQQISKILLYELKDPRIHGILTVMEVRTTADLKYAKVYVSYMGEEALAEETFVGLNHCAGYVRNQLKSRVKIRMLPTLTFIRDTSIAYASHISKVIDDATAHCAPQEDDD